MPNRPDDDWMQGGCNDGCRMPSRRDDDWMSDRCNNRDWMQDRCNGGNMAPGTGNGGKVSPETGNGGGRMPEMGDGRGRMPDDCVGNCPIAMAYVPWQQWNDTYDLEKGFLSGTIFPELDLPWVGGACK